MGYKHNTFNGYIQLDALEFLRFFLEDISKELNENNVLMPYKEITIQTGLSRLSFILKRTFLGCFKCYQNKKYEKMSYEDYFKTKDKNVYNQIIDYYNNNIVDPLEKFSSINGSISISHIKDRGIGDCAKMILPEIVNNTDKLIIIDSGDILAQ